MAKTTNPKVISEFILDGEQFGTKTISPSDPLIQSLIKKALEKRKTMSVNKKSP